jgi:hypothetical protein
MREIAARRAGVFSRKNATSTQKAPLSVTEGTLAAASTCTKFTTPFLRLLENFQREVTN